MFIVNSYSLAIILCIVTMLCWGSWGNTQKLASKSWRYELFYWDYVVGILLFSIVMGLTLGSYGSAGRSFLADLGQVETSAVVSAFIGGVIWGLGTLMSYIAARKAGTAISYALGQGTPMIAALLGVFVWKEFKGSSKLVDTLLGLMFVLFISGLSLIVASGGN